MLGDNQEVFQPLRLRLNGGCVTGVIADPGCAALKAGEQLVVLVFGGTGTGKTYTLLGDDTKRPTATGKTRAGTHPSPAASGIVEQSLEEVLAADGQTVQSEFYEYHTGTRVVGETTNTQSVKDALRTYLRGCRGLRVTARADGVSMSSRSWSEFRVVSCAHIMMRYTRPP
jgi:hypothetical protein